MEESVATIVCTQVASTDRGMPADELGELAADIFGPDRVEVRALLPDALETAVTLADGAGLGAGILVVGSVILAGEARTLLVSAHEEEQEDSSQDAEVWSVGEES